MCGCSDSGRGAVVGRRRKGCVGVLIQGAGGVSGKEKRRVCGCSDSGSRGLEDSVGRRREAFVGVLIQGMEVCAGMILCALLVICQDWLLLSSSCSDHTPTGSSDQWSTALFQCLATLVVNVPYHRLQPGLLSRVVKQIRHFLSHKGTGGAHSQDVR